MKSLQIFESEYVLTYSENVYLKLNYELLTIAQSKIYAKQQASASNLDDAEVINSVLSSFVVTNDEKFELMMENAINKAEAMEREKRQKKTNIRGFRLIGANYNKVLKIISMLKDFLPPPKKTLIELDVIDKKKRHVDRDEQISIVINAILFLFSYFDINSNSMRVVSQGVER
jgi:hypothetical protein